MSYSEVISPPHEEGRACKSHKHYIMKKTIIVVTILIVVSLASFGIFWFISKKPGIFPSVNINSTNANTNQQGIHSFEPSEQDKISCASTKDEANCLKIGYYSWSRSEVSGAIVSNDFAKCDALTQKNEIDNCKLQIAIAKKDLALCDQISMSIDCKAKIILARNSWNDCKLIGHTKAIDDCFGFVATNNKTKGEEFCNTVPKEDTILCLDVLYGIMAKTSFNYFLCKKISTPQGVSSCLKSLPPDKDGDEASDYMEENIYRTSTEKKDTDDDGLGDGEEIFVYKTNPLQSDTDNDGYDDGTEVKNGHDPLR